MEIKRVSDVLHAAGLSGPTFAALIPDVANYKVMLFQPKGEIEASAAGVGSRNRDLASEQFRSFLEAAVHRDVALAVAPEYAMPWEVLAEAIRSDLTPASGKLWVLGCESIRYALLQTLKTDLAQKAVLLFEPLEADPERFVDPLAYVFHAPVADGSGSEKLVVLIQFKTRPMGDDDHFETKNLQTGTHIYQFGGDGNIRLISLICSDVFGFTDAHAADIYDRTLVIHIQLNPKPRQPQYRQYRDKLLGLSRDETELICLNWASDVSEWSGGKQKDWHNVSGTAWYLRPDKFDSRDDTLCANHKRGLYYTWLTTLRFHALFFNYRPGVFVLEASKVAHVAVPGVLSRRRGPQLVAVLVWDSTASAWTEQVAADDGFSAIASESGDAKEKIEQLSATYPLYAERLFALCAGQVGSTDDWHALCQLDSCAIDASEVIHRMTFCQDTDEGAAKFRIARLKLCGRLVAILKTTDYLPPPLSDFAGGFQFDWSPQAPHHNARTEQGGPATVVYMGEQAAQNEIEAAKARLAAFLHRSSPGPDESLRARQRLAVWFQVDGEIRLLDPHRYVQIDQPNDSSEFDVGRES